MSNVFVTRQRVERGVGVSAALAALLVATPLAPPRDAPPRVQPNDNRVPAGTLRDGVLTIRLVVATARWYPEAEDGPWADVAAFAEEGHAPRIPGPLVRVPTGTTIVASMRNALADSTIFVHGLVTRPAAADDSIAVPPGETRTVRFTAGRPGTYLYRATPGTVNYDLNEREQLAGALVVDSGRGRARSDDRIFVINIWGEPLDSVTYRNALAINGKSWPYTEHVTATVGDSLRWRVINGSVRNHPMHLHGFYFRIDARGTFLSDTLYAPAQRRLAVTEDLSSGHTMALAWRPERPGNWLFHCHLVFHVVPETRLDPPLPGAHDWHDLDPGKHMAGLVLGISVRPAPHWSEPARGTARKIRLYVNEGAKRGRSPRALGFVLQRGAAPPAPDSVEIPGTVLALTRDEPTDITVVNRLAEATAVHWHGIELESYSDGVAGWSGRDGRLAPVIAPGDSFTARLTLPRPGTFIYHTHLDDVVQLTSGLYGAIVVLEPGERFDPRSDHVFVVGWDGLEEPPHLVVNGDSLPPPLELGYGVAHRLRLVNIGPAQRVVFALRRDSTVFRWRPLAKDGAALPPRVAVEGPARQRLAVGETYDVEFVPPARGEYLLTLGPPDKPMAHVQGLIVR
ncbi:MAG: multicopper oxidase domain-containing protein [Gemmatimonadales bacterium]